MSRIVLLVELSDPDDFDDYDIAALDVAEIRQYDMTDHEKCALQFVREMIAQGRTPDANRQRLITIGGTTTIASLQGAEQFPVSTVPYRVWKPVSPRQPGWSVKEA